MEQLLKDLINNDSKAQQRVWDEYYKQMYTLSIRYTDNVEDTEDVLIESFMSLFNNSSKIQNNNIFSYLYTIVKNYSINKVRSKKTKFEVDVVDYKDMFSCVDHQFSNLEYQEIIDVVEKLPKGYKTVFDSYVFEDKSHETIGKELNMTSGTSRSQLSKARKFLKKQLLLRGIK